MLSAFFALGYIAPAIGMGCQALLLRALHRNRALATPLRRMLLSVGMGAALLWAALAASDIFFGGSIGVAVVAYFLPANPRASASLRSAVRPSTRCCTGGCPRGACPPQACLGASVRPYSSPLLCHWRPSSSGQRPWVGMRLSKLTDCLRAARSPHRQIEV